MENYVTRHGLSLYIVPTSPKVSVVRDERNRVIRLHGLDIDHKFTYDGSVCREACFNWTDRKEMLIFDEDERLIEQSYSCGAIHHVYRWNALDKIIYKMIDNDTGYPFEEVNEYDSFGNVIYHRQSSGLEIFYTRDEDGNLLSWKDSNGSQKIFDNRN